MYTEICRISQQKMSMLSQLLVWLGYSTTTEGVVRGEGGGGGNGPLQETRQ